MNYRTWMALLLGVALGASACLKPVDENSGSDAVLEAQGSDALAFGDSGPADGQLAETLPAACVPECPIWQVCSDGMCTVKACSAHKDCNEDPLPSGTDPHWCLQSKCQAWQCAKDQDCPKGEACNTQLYTCYPLTAGCTSVAQCSDGDACTTDTCELDGSCSHKAVGGCCNVDKDCADQNDCTTDLCQANKCANKSIAGCCKDDASCDDGKACTKDICASSGCQNIAVGLCCSVDGDCADKEPETVDKCQGGQCIHQWPGLASSCGGGSACTANGCASGTCASGLCNYAAPTKAGCCTQASQCNPYKKCVLGVCNAMTCAEKAVTGPGTHTWMPMDDAKLSGWSLTASSKSVYFHQTALTKVAGAGSLRYGVPSQISFEDSTPNKGSATSPAFALPKNAKLRFAVLLDVSPGAGIHQAGIDLVHPQTGAVLSSVWSKNVQLNSGTTAGKWIDQELALGAGTAAGTQVALRIWFDQVKYDTSNKQKMGFAVDELEVRGDCP